MREHTGDSPRTWRRTALALAILFLADLAYAGQGLFSIFVALVGLILLTVGALLAWWSARAPVARSRAVRAGLYLLLGIATIAATRFHAATAEDHAARVIAACESYKLRRGALPDRLDELVPEFLSAVPPAKYTLAYGKFSYIASSSTAHTLMYVALPPFGRRLYHFEQGIWTQLD